MKALVSLVALAVLALTAIACQQPAPATDAAPTYTPYPTLTDLPTHTPYPTPTAVPTPTPYPTYTPYPTPEPLPTHTPYPTYTPYPTPTTAAKPVPTPTNTPQPVQPGRTLDDAVEAGGVLQGSNGTEIVAVSINPYAWAWIDDISPSIDLNGSRYHLGFVSPPDEGKRYYMVTVEISYISGAGTLDVDEYDFKLTGSSRFIYDTHCVGDLPEELDGEVFLGGTAQGNVCFEVPEEESGFVLIHEPGNARSRRYLKLE